MDRETINVTLESYNNMTKNVIISFEIIDNINRKRRAIRKIYNLITLDKMNEVAIEGDYYLKLLHTKGWTEWVKNEIKKLENL